MVSKKALQIVDMMWKIKNDPAQEGPVDYNARRNYVEMRHAQQTTAPGVRFESLELNGVPAVCAIPEHVENSSAILYIHGGGFITGSANSSKGYISFLAQSCGLPVYAVSYRLAPENPYPAAVDDCICAWQKLTECFSGNKIALVGGSAGGNLCLATALLAKEKGMHMPAALALYSPVGDITDTLPSRRVNASFDCSLKADLDLECQKTYLQGHDPYDPHISPVYADLTDFPPMLIVADSAEILLDDAILLDAHARRFGVETELHITQNLFHDFPSVGPELPEAAKIMEHTTAFLRRYGL